MSQEPDWRLQTGGTRLVAGHTFTWKRWLPPKPSWDHDHCALCGQKITHLNLPDAHHEGYADEKEYHWLCVTCASDFHEALHLKLIGGPPSQGNQSPSPPQ